MFPQLKILIIRGVSVKCSYRDTKYSLEAKLPGVWILPVISLWLIFKLSTVSQISSCIFVAPSLIFLLFCMPIPQAFYMNS
jgi:hypothetical protein